MDLPEVEGSGNCQIRVLNDRVLILPDESEYQNLTDEVCSALKSGKLVLPEVYEGFAKKTPEWGVIVTSGDKCEYEWEYGQRVHFARLASVRFDYQGKKYCLVREYDIDFVEELCPTQDPTQPSSSTQSDPSLTISSNLLENSTGTILTTPPLLSGC